MQLTKYEQDLLLCANYAIATVDARGFCKDAQKWISRYGSARQRSEGYKWLDRIQLRIYDGAMDPFHEVNKQYGKENKMTDTKQICESIEALPDGKKLVYAVSTNEVVHGYNYACTTDDLKALVAENEALKEHLANTLNNHGDLYTLLRHYPNALAEVRQIPDVIEWWLDKAYGVTPCVMVRYDRDDPKTERIRVGDQSDLNALVAENQALRQKLNCIAFYAKDHDEPKSHCALCLIEGVVSGDILPIETAHGGNDE